MIKSVLIPDKEKQYTTNPQVHSVGKINVKNTDLYRNLLSTCSKNIIHQTYQMKRNRAYRIVFKIFINLHHWMRSNLLIIN